MRGKETLAMVRSLGIAAVVVGLAWTGLAGAQSVPPGTAAPRERYMTVREEGKPPQRCKLLKTWHESDGSTAFQVQAVDSGELITIVQSGSAPAEGGHKTVASRIFRWGLENKPSAKTPVPPPNATVLGTPVGQPASSSTPAQSAPTTVSPPANPSAQFATMPRKPEPAARTARPPEPTPTSIVPAPILPQSLSSKTPAPAHSPTTIVVTPRTDSPSKTVSTTATTDATNKIAPTPEPRLVPTTSGNATGATPCGPCCQSSCACCTPAPLRQTWLNRIFKSRGSSTAVACQPATCTPAPLPPAVANAAVEPAHPGDWRASWGKVEPWKAAPTASAEQSGEEVSKHMARAPIEAPKQADPLKDPDWYRGMALKEKPHSSYAPDTNAPATPSHGEETVVLPGGPEMGPTSAMPVGPPAPGRVITLSADEGNAFWTPPAPPKREKKGKKGQAEQAEQAEQPEPSGPRYNAFDRDPNAPPRDPAAAMGQPGMGPMGMGGPGLPVGMRGMPPPPPGPMPYLPQQPRMPSPPPMVDTGVPSGMANAFTLAGTRRPIPADFGGTPQEPNGFGTSDVRVEGPAHPPQPYNIPPMPGAAMPGMMPMIPPQGPVVGVNPLMAVPPTPVVSHKPAGLHDSENVPQLLASLKDSQLPSQREWAAEQLSELNWHQHPRMVESLTKSAKDDPAASVRAACVRALAHLRVDKPEVVAAVQKLRNDRDPRVRAEVEEALSTLAATSQPDSCIRPASHR
jgi:hypothetical protein